MVTDIVGTAMQHHVRRQVAAVTDNDGRLLGREQLGASSDPAGPDGDVPLMHPHRPVDLRIVMNLGPSCDKGSATQAEQPSVGRDERELVRQPEEKR